MDDLTIPKELITEEATELFRKLMPELTANGMPATSVGLLSSYCNILAQIQKLQTLIGSNPVVKNNRNMIVPSPLIASVGSLLATAGKLAKLLGITGERKQKPKIPSLLAFSQEKRA